MRKLLASLLTVVFFISLAGCSSISNSTTSTPSASSLPASGSYSEEVIMGTISHEATNPNRDQQGNLLPWIYDGEEVYLEYKVNASGDAKNVGFLMFVDGVPQPYKINDPSASAEYMHIFDLQADNVDYPFTFIFTPVTGKQGDTLELTIASIYYPEFKPNMQDTFGYFGYHALLSAVSPIEFHADAPTHNDVPSSIMASVRTATEPVSEELLDSIREATWRDDIGLDTLNTDVFNLTYINGGLSLGDNYYIGTNGSVTMDYLICGVAGIEYTTTFYINHQPVTTSEGISFDTVLEEGVVSRITLTLNCDQIEDYSTFYAISVPKNATSTPDIIWNPLKAPSTLLYKHETQQQGATHV